MKKVILYVRYGNIVDFKCCYLFYNDIGYIYILINLNSKKFNKLMDDFKFVVLKVFVYFVSLIFNINFVDDIFYVLFYVLFECYNY